MKWTRLAIPLCVLLMIAVGAPSAWAQGTKKATGTISAVTGNSVTVKASSGDMTFSVDKDTTITTPGGGTKEKAAKAQGKSGVSSTDVLKVGQAVEVSYHDMGGTLHAASIRTVAKVPADKPAAPPAAASKTAHGTVKDVSASSLTITNQGKDMTFAVDASTHAVGAGLGTATKSTGGKAPITDLIKAGENVSVIYHDMGGTLHAASVHVLTAAKK
jgi:Domain of unknown function (DUF5666)